MDGGDEFLEGLVKLFAEEDDDLNPLIHNVFGPRQEVLDDVPIHEYDLAEFPGVEFGAMTEARLARFRALALVLLGEHLVPVLPLPNPDTGISHHIIRLIDSNHPKFKVDLLFRDCDLYFAGFRRAIVSEGEENWGTWFIYGDLMKEGTGPAFLQNAVKMGLDSSHRSKDVTRIGGNVAMEEIFFTLSRLEDRVRIIDPSQNDDVQPRQDEDEAENESTGEDVNNLREARMSKALQRRLARVVARVIVVFSEALRLRSLYREVLGQLERQWGEAVTLQPRSWKLINNWGHLSDHVQETLQEYGELDLESALPSQFEVYGFATITMSDLIGPEGELMIAKREELCFISSEKLQKHARQDGAANVQDPGFLPPAAA